jgi:hypothetical protein
LNEWLLIPLTLVAFVLIAVAILAICFGLWLGAHTLVNRLTRAVPLSRLRRS